MAHDVICAKIPVDTDRHESSRSHKTREKEVVVILADFNIHLTWLVYFPLITLLLMLKFMRKRSINSSDNANSLLESWVYKKWQTSAIIWKISDSNLQNGRYGPNSGVSQIIRKRWQHWCCIVHRIECSLGPGSALGENGKKREW